MPFGPTTFSIQLSNFFKLELELRCDFRHHDLLSRHILPSSFLLFAQELSVTSALRDRTCYIPKILGNWNFRLGKFTRVGKMNSRLREDPPAFPVKRDPIRTECDFSWECLSHSPPEGH